MQNRQMPFLFQAYALHQDKLLLALTNWGIGIMDTDPNWMLIRKRIIVVRAMTRNVL